LNYAILASSSLLLNDTFHRKTLMFSATQPKENEEATVSPSPRSMEGSTVRPWS